MEELTSRDAYDFYGGGGVGGSHGRSRNYRGFASDGGRSVGKASEMLAVHGFIISFDHHHWRYRFMADPTPSKKSEVSEVEEP